MDGRPEIIRAKCFPLRLDKVKAKDIEKWLVTLRRNNLIIQYIVDEKPYIKLTSWEKHQQVRAKRRKFPELDANAQIITDEINGNQMISDACNSPRNPIQSLSESLSLSESNTPYGEIVQAFNDICCSLPKVQSITDKRKTAMKKLFKKNNIDWLKELFAKIQASDFLTGKIKDWKADFDWIIREDHAVAIYEGKYDNKVDESLERFRRLMNDRKNGRNNDANVIDCLPINEGTGQR